MKVLLWADNVNQRILDSTSITAGTGSVVEDTMESGIKRRRLTSNAVPDSFPVTMDFDWLEKDNQGFSEYDRFMRWYKYAHKRGTIPFSFPSITRFNTQGSLQDSLYLITTEPQAVKSGYSMRVTMTWKEYFTGVIEVGVDTKTIIKVNGDSTLLRIYYNQDITSDSALAHDFSFAILSGAAISDFVEIDASYFSSHFSKENFTEFSFVTPLESGSYIFMVDGIKGGIYV